MRLLLIVCAPGASAVRWVLPARMGNLTFGFIELTSKGLGKRLCAEPGVLRGLCANCSTRVVPRRICPLFLQRAAAPGFGGKEE